MTRIAVAIGAASRPSAPSARGETRAVANIATIAKVAQSSCGSARVSVLPPESAAATAVAE